MVSKEYTPTREEWGVEYEYDVDDIEVVAVTSEREAREIVAVSPTDRGVRKRYVTEWEEA